MECGPQRTADIEETAVSGDLEREIKNLMEHGNLGPFLILKMLRR